MKKVSLSKRDIKDINQEIVQLYGLQDYFDPKDAVSILDDTYVMKDNVLQFFYHEDLLLPCLRILLENNFLKKVIVNMGAVPFVAKGADIMRPGIVGVDTDVKEDEIVAIVDEKNMVPLAVGQSLFSKEEMIDLETGKMVLNLHRVGDEVWKFSS